jgi:hypothetical protein
MPEALIPIAGSIIGGLTNKKSSTAPATQTVNKDPWSGAQPWMLENIRQGQALQGQYQANPFSDLQKQSYSNQYQNSDAYRSLAAQLMGSLGKTQAFDRNNPQVKPTMPFDISALMQYRQQAQQPQQPQQPQQYQPQQSIAPTQGLLGQAFAQAPQAAPQPMPQQMPQQMPQYAPQQVFNTPWDSTPTFYQDYMTGLGA